MRITAATSLALLASLSAAHAGDAKKLDKAEINALLPSIVSTDDVSYQTFDASGRTYYEGQRGPSYGSWQVRDDQYCSQWPPSPTWVCYDVELRTDEEGNRSIAWTGDSGNPTFTQLSKREAE